MSSRVWTATPAVRQRVPVFIGLCGPSGSGKTYSALRLATGMQRVSGGGIAVIDTEQRRATYYADAFKYDHIPFDPPHSPRDYASALSYALARGYETIVIDSMSHEHEGAGGVLEMHDQIVQRMSRGDAAKAERVKMAAWIEPKRQRRELINAIVQSRANIICCFRAKEKLRIERGKEPTPLGWMPIAGDEYVYEMTAQLLLYPGSQGRPTWRPDMPGEAAMIKLPGFFRDAFAAAGDGAQLDEDTGERIARWAASAPAAHAAAQREAVAQHDASPPAGATLAELRDALAARGLRTSEQRRAWLAEHGCHGDPRSIPAEIIAALITEARMREPGDDTEETTT